MRRGLSAVEVIVALLVMATVGLVLANVLSATPRQTRHQVLVAELEREARQGLEWIERHLHFAALDTLVWDDSDPDNPYLVFRKRTISDSSGALAYSAAYELGCLPLGDEPRNDLDDNRNGVIDEGELYLLEPDGTRLTLSGSVLEGSFEVVLPSGTARTLQLRLQLCRRYDGRAGTFPGPDSAGVYSPSAGFVLRTVDRQLLVRN